MLRHLGQRPAGERREAGRAPAAQAATPADAEADTAIAPLLDAAPDGTTLIDGAPLDAGKPMPTCRLPTQNPLAFNLRCAASPSNPTPGGRVQNGT